MNNSCIFCKIANNQIPAKKHFENDHLMVINDINPQAKVHALIIPLKHIPTMAEENAFTPELTKAMFDAVAKTKSLLSPNKGFKIVSNNGPDAGQSVNHLHWHFLVD